MEVEEEEEEWTPVSSTQNRKKLSPTLPSTPFKKKPSDPIVVVNAKVVGGENTNEDQNTIDVGRTNPAAPRDDPQAATTARTAAATTEWEEDVPSDAKKSYEKSRIEGNIPAAPAATSAKGNTTPALSEKYESKWNVANAPSSSTKDVENTTKEPEEASNEPTPHVNIPSLTERDIAQKKMAVMKSSTIDYDHRVNDTALPRTDHDADQSSLNISPVPAHEPGEPTGPTMSPILHPNSHAAEKTGACSATTSAASEARLADDAVTSSLLLRVSSLAFENEMLTARNTLLIEQNEALLAKLAETKRQSVEAVQQVHLKAYIAETARSAAVDRATRLEYLLADLATNISVEEVVRLELQDAIAGTAAAESAIPYVAKWKTRARKMQALAMEQAGSALLFRDAPPGHSPQPSQRLARPPQQYPYHATSSRMMPHRPYVNYCSVQIAEDKSASEHRRQLNKHVIQDGMHPPPQINRRSPSSQPPIYVKHHPGNDKKNDSPEPWMTSNDNPATGGSSSFNVISTSSSPRYERILSRLRRGDHAS